MGVSIRSAYNQAIVHKDAGNFDAAFQLYHEALAIRTAVYGQASQVIGDTLYNMANAHMLQGSRKGEKVDRSLSSCKRWIHPTNQSASLSLIHLECMSDAAQLYAKAAAAFVASLGYVYDQQAGFREVSRLLTTHCDIAGLSTGRRTMHSDRPRTALSSCYSSSPCLISNNGSIRPSVHTRRSMYSVHLVYRLSSIGTTTGTRQHT